MAQYKVDWMEKKTTSTGKVKIDATLSEPTGQQHEKVTIWGDFPGFEQIMPGQEVIGNITVKQNEQYTYKTLYPVSSPAWSTKKPGTSSIAAAQTRKAEGIEKSQARKEEGIKLAGTARDATLLTLEWARANQVFNEDDVRVKWLEWRKWLSDNFGDDVPFV